MKRISALLLAAMMLFALVACGESGEKSADVSAENVSTSQRDDIGLTTNDVMEKLTTDDYSFGSYISVVTNNYDVDYFVNEYGNISVFCFKKDGTDKLFCVLIKTKTNLNDVVISKAKNVQDRLLSYTSDNVSCTSFQKNDDLIFCIYAPEYENEIYNLPHTIKDINKSDFFADKERQKTYERLCKSYQYQELEEYVNQYIDNCSPEDCDSAFQIVDITSNLTKIINDCKIQYDDFEEKYTIYFNGADTISSSTNIVPTVCGSSFVAKVGFQQEDWLFFNRLSIKFDDGKIETHRLDSWDVERNIVQGGIEEYTIIHIEDEKLEKYENSGIVVLRFENTDTGGAVEHVLTSEELNGIIGAIKLRVAYVNLENMLYRWNNY